MSKGKFWRLCEQYFDRFYTASTTLGILKVGGYLSLPWTPVFVCIAVGAVGGTICGSIAAVAEAHNPEGLTT